MKQNTTNIKIIRSKRKTVALEIRKDFQVILRAPFGMTESAIRRFVEGKSLWLQKHMKLMQEKIASANKQTEPKFTAEEIHRLSEQAITIVPQKVAYYAPIVGVQVGKITIRSQVSRWGSCSSKGNLNFNCLLMLTPNDVIDYVVVHELCHRKELNHSAKFWAEVTRVLPNYKVQQRWLRDNGNALIQRLR